MDGVLLRLSLALLLFLSGCSCEHEPESFDEAPFIDEPAIEQDPGPWPRALVADLAPATPATLVTVHRDRIEVENHALVATWPAADIARTRTDAPPDALDWPRIAGSVADLDGAEMRIAPLHELLATARRAERAASGAGHGAGVFNLRVASDVPFALVERVLYTAAQAGYGAPRVLLEAGGTERMLPWPSAPPRDAPTREEIEAALRAVERGTAPVGHEVDDASPESRATLDAERLELRAGDEVVCAIEGPLEIRAVERCEARVDAEQRSALTVVVAPDLSFSRLTSALQTLSGFAQIRVTRSTSRGE